MFKIIHESINSLNSNMFFAGIMMLTLNIGSRYVQLNLSPSAESYLKYAITKEFLVFTIAWMGTRNIYVALTLTAVFVVLADYALNDKSNFCILPENFKKLQDSIDTNNDKIISELEIKSAMDILEKAKKQRENRIQLGYLSYYDNVKI
uniref:EF-hand domain-containing protein n=1 Tax=viral metagenome TaxID=1070528 RepID=A0A6C0EYR9_9ZZZZ